MKSRAKFSRPHVFFALFSILIGLSFQACFAQEKEDALTDYARFPMIARLDLNEEKVTSIMGSFFWLDDERFMLSVQLEGVNGKPQLSSDPKKYTVMVWNIRTKKVTKYMPGEIRCVNPQDGYVQIHSPADDEKFLGSPPKRYLQGYWGEDGSGLQAYDFYYKSKEPGKGGYVNQFSCRYYSGWVNDSIPGDVVFPLREDHGVIHFKIYKVPLGPNEETQLFFRPFQSEIEHKVKYREDEIFLFSDTEYAPFANKYLLQGNMHQDNGIDPREKIPRSIRLLNPDGSVEGIQPPAFMWERARSGHIRARISRLGILWRYSDAYNVPGLNGIWLQEAHRYTRILPGTSWAVSPNGCRVASKSRSEISIIELCRS